MKLPQHDHKGTTSAEQEVDEQDAAFLSVEAGVTREKLNAVGRVLSSKGWNHTPLISCYCTNLVHKNQVIITLGTHMHLTFDKLRMQACVDAYCLTRETELTASLVGVGGSILCEKDKEQEPVLLDKACMKIKIVQLFEADLQLRIENTQNAAFWCIVTLPRDLIRATIKQS